MIRLVSYPSEVSRQRKPAKGIGLTVRKMQLYGDKPKGGKECTALVWALALLSEGTLDIFLNSEGI